MATFTFDGSSSVTATKADTVVISADPASFTQLAETTINGASAVVLSFGNTTLTITGTNFVDGGLPNVFVSGGTFDYLASANQLGANANNGNLLSIFGSATTAAAAANNLTSTNTSKVAVFGGLGVNDPNDGADTIDSAKSFGTKGAMLIHGSGGGDTITQPGNVFDSTVVANIYGDQGNDTISLNQANVKASIFVAGGADSDNITVQNNGSTTIVGGTGFTDSLDGADTIRFQGDGGTFNVYGNAGADDIANTGTFAGGSVANVYGGIGNDTVVLAGSSSSKLFVTGGEGIDNITVTQTGTGAVTIYGGISSSDPTDQGDVITLGSAAANAGAGAMSGTWNVFGNGGADAIAMGTNRSFDSASVVNVYGGTGSDTVSLTGGAAGARLFVAGGEANDQINVTTGGANTTIYGGISNADSTDGSDTITVSGTGTANIFANGGDDQVTYNASTSDSTTVATILGGGGNDTVTIGIQTGAAAGTTIGSINVSGNEGADTFVITKGAAGALGSGAGQGVSIQDFTVAQADKLQVVLSGATANAAVVSAGTFSTADAAIAAAANAASGAASKAAVAAGGGSTYLVLSDANAAFNPQLDQVIKLTGVTDPTTVTSSITIVS